MPGGQAWAEGLKSPVKGAGTLNPAVLSAWMQVGEVGPREALEGIVNNSMLSHPLSQRISSLLGQRVSGL